MAERPIFIPAKYETGYVKELMFPIPWASGFALSQKQKNARSRHEKAAMDGYFPLLEVSTKSEEKAGRHLSAFHLKVDTEVGSIPLECAFQGSKVFEYGGPFNDLYLQDPKSAKRDTRLQNSGRLVHFQFKQEIFPLLPRTVFYDWLYIGAVYPHRNWLKKRIDGERVYAGFTDIEFNPKKSINCQARSCALFVALMQLEIIDEAVRSSSNFIDLIQSRESTNFTRKENLFSDEGLPLE